MAMVNVVAFQKSPSLGQGPPLGGPNNLRSQFFGSEMRNKAISRTKNLRRSCPNGFKVKCIIKGMGVLPPELAKQFINGETPHGSSVPPTVIPGATKTISKSDFPHDFIWGTATSALQTEGRTDRGINSWDFFLPDERAVDSYNLIEEDIKCVKEMGVTAYRFSIAWSRILPTGSMAGGISQKGIDFYNKLINDLLANGITPFVTLFHFDLPIDLLVDYNGFLNKKRIVEDFTNYADICFKEFGDRVKNWQTLNEPNLYGKQGFPAMSPHPSKPSDSFTAMHNLILCHAHAVDLYRDKYQATQGGDISVVLNLQWYEPFSKKKVDKDARDRALDFHFGWWLGPLTYGDYPFVIKTIARDYLPRFTEHEKEIVKNSFDNIGVNYYTCQYTEGLDPLNPDHPIYTVDDYQYIRFHNEKNDVPVGEVSETGLIFYPEGLKESLLYLSREYHIKKMYITENGCSQLRYDHIPKETVLDDQVRIKFIDDHLNAIAEARSQGANVRGYFVWTLMDNMEMMRGFTHGFGLYHTDFNDGFKRTAKNSAKCYKNFMAGHPWGVVEPSRILPLEKTSENGSLIRK